MAVNKQKRPEKGTLLYPALLRRILLENNPSGYPQCNRYEEHYMI